MHRTGDGGDELAGKDDRPSRAVLAPERGDWRRSDPGTKPNYAKV